MSSLLANLGLDADRLEVQDTATTIKQFDHWTNSTHADTGLCVTWSGSDMPSEYAA